MGPINLELPCRTLNLRNLLKSPANIFTFFLLLSMETCKLLPYILKKERTAMKLVVFFVAEKVI